MTENTIKKTIEIDAPADVVFNALIDPQDLAHWLPDAAILEPKIGGKFRFSFLQNSSRRNCDPQDGDFFSEGKILEFVKNKKLVYTWKWADVSDFPETVVSWELEQISNNKTRLTLTHSGFTGKEPSHKGIKDHNEGWSKHLNELTAYCRGK